MSLAAAISAVVASIGFPQVAFGIFIVLGILGGAASFSDFGVSDLTFEEAGLRVHLRSAHCLIPWTSIRVVDPVGPDGYRMLRLGIADLDRLRELVSSTTARKHAESIFGSSGDELLLMPWTAGLDGHALERAIRDGIASVPDRLN